MSILARLQYSWPCLVPKTVGMQMERAPFLKANLHNLFQNGPCHSDCCMLESLDFGLSLGRHRLLIVILALGYTCHKFLTGITLTNSRITLVNLLTAVHSSLLGPML